MDRETSTRRTASSARRPRRLTEAPSSLDSKRAMSSATAPRVLVVYKKSAWQTNVKERKNPRFLELLQRGHESVDRLEAAHRAHEQCLEETRRALADLGARAVFRFRGDEGLVDGFDLVVTVGGDGTLLWAARWVGSETPVVAINSAPDDSVGHFCAGRRGKVREVLEATLRGGLPAFRIARMEVAIDGDVMTRRVLNDVLFAHASPAATTRYLLRVDDGRRTAYEEQKSSGLWVGPAAGSTAAQRSAGGAVLPAESDLIQYVVREPYVPDDGSGRSLRVPKLRVGTVPRAGAIGIVSKVREARLYVDGPHRVRDVPIGAEIWLRASDEPLTLIGYPRAMAERAAASKSAKDGRPVRRVRSNSPR